VVLGRERVQLRDWHWGLKFKYPSQRRKRKKKGKKPRDKERKKRRDSVLNPMMTVYQSEGIY
jgi:hypothetical protein